jgi:hypothetical protein
MKTLAVASSAVTTVAEPSAALGTTPPAPASSSSADAGSLRQAGEDYAGWISDGDSDALADALSPKCSPQSREDQKTAGAFLTGVSAKLVSAKLTGSTGTTAIEFKGGVFGQGTTKDVEWDFTKGHWYLADCSTS